MNPTPGTSARRPWRDVLARPAWRGVLLGLGCALIAWWLTRAEFVRGVEDWVLDGCFFYRGSRATTANVVLIELDEPSLRRLKKPLAYLSPELGHVVRHVKKAGAAAIGIDLLVPEDLADVDAIRDLNGKGSMWTMGRAVVVSPDNVVLPQRQAEDEWIHPLKAWRPTPDSDPYCRGFADISEDGDQFLRRQHLIMKENGQAVLHLALAVLARARGVEVTWDDRLRLGGEPVPLGAEEKLRINFVGPPGTAFRRVPFHQVLAAADGDAVEVPDLRGAVVFIGMTARSQQDYHPTPYANHYARYLSGGDAPGLMAGVEVHAHILATLHDRAFITTPWWLAPVPLLLIVGVLLGVTYARLSLEAGFLVAVAYHFAWKGVALAAFKAGHWRVEVVAMLLLGSLVYAVTFAVRWRLLRRMFGVVKSEAVALALENDPRRLALGGEERDVTVLFADIRRFTDFSEKHGPGEVVTMLNAYFGVVVPVIEAEGGTVDKYMGDGIMAVFGAPTSRTDHALRAVRAAAAMVRQVHIHRGRWAAFDRAGVWANQGGLRIGVGVHSGKVVVGAVGSRRRLDYTAIGDAVNAAARIEAENKHFGTEILVSGATRARLSGPEQAGLGLAVEPVEALVKGKEERLLLYPLAVEVPA
jgi:adenylate cyclase